MLIGIFERTHHPPPPPSLQNKWTQQPPSLQNKWTHQPPSPHYKINVDGGPQVSVLYFEIIGKTTKLDVKHSEELAKMSPLHHDVTVMWLVAVVVAASYWVCDLVMGLEPTGLKRFYSCCLDELFLYSFSFNVIAEFGHLSWETHCAKNHRWSNMIFFFVFFFWWRFFFLYTQMRWRLRKQRMTHDQIPKTRSGK